jgi:hypothetical protein
MVLRELILTIYGERQKVGGRATYSAVGIQNSGRNHKRRSQSAKRLDPRLFGALRLKSAKQN